MSDSPVRADLDLACFTAGASFPKNAVLHELCDLPAAPPNFFFLGRSLLTFGLDRAGRDKPRFASYMPATASESGRDDDADHPSVREPR